MGEEEDRPKKMFHPLPSPLYTPATQAKGFITTLKIVELYMKCSEIIHLRGPVERRGFRSFVIPEIPGKVIPYP